MKNIQPSIKPICEQYSDNLLSRPTSEFTDPKLMINNKFSAEKHKK